MCYLKSIALYAVGLFCISQSVYAGCERNPEKPMEVFQMDMGRVVVSPEAPINSVIASKTYQMPKPAKPQVIHCTDLYDFYTIIVGNRTEIKNKIYATNVPGIGIRLRRGNIVIPNRQSSTIQSGKIMSYYITVSFKVELIKTAEVTGSGAIDPGLWIEYGMEDAEPFNRGYFGPNSVIIVSPSCDITSGKNMTKYLNVANINDLKKSGDTTQDEKFNIKLRCAGALNEKGYSNVKMVFSGETPDNLTNNSGVLINEDTSGSGAKGIGIQIIKDNQPLVFNKEYLLGRMSDKETHHYDIPLVARYYQYDDKRTTGRVESHMVFDITYD